jgi:hypothetical protein
VGVIGRGWVLFEPASIGQVSTESIERSLPPM